MRYPGFAELARNATDALGASHTACLLSNHGTIAVGESPGEAYSLTELLEQLSELYYRARAAGEPVILTPEQMAELRTATGKDLDVQFLTLMRQHHLGGIHMAQAILELSDDKDVTWLAGTMVSSQQGEINLIDSLLAEARAN